MERKIDIDKKDELDSSPVETEESKEKQMVKHPKNWLDITITIILIFVIVGLLIWIFWPAKPRVLNISPTALDNSSTITSTETSGSSTTSSTAPSSAIDKSSIIIKILNGNKRTGEAAALKEKMEADGFKIESTGNAKSTYETTIVYYKKGKESQANLVKEFLAKTYQTKTEENNDLVGSADVLIVLGLK
jgi:cytoskeletal protein RodZ